MDHLVCCRCPPLHLACWHLHVAAGPGCQGGRRQGTGSQIGTVSAAACRWPGALQPPTGPRSCRAQQTRRACHAKRAISVEEVGQWQTVAVVCARQQPRRMIWLVSKAQAFAPACSVCLPQLNAHLLAACPVRRAAYSSALCARHTRFPGHLGCLPGNAGASSACVSAFDSQIERHHSAHVKLTFY